MDKQLVMERTGHRSLEGVRSYKRTSDTQQEALSDILNCSKRTRVEDPSPQYSIATASPTNVQSASGSTVFAKSNTSQELRALSLPSSVFNDCTVNFYVGTPQSSNEKKRRRTVILDDSDSD